MASADETQRRYSTPFQRHLSFFDRDNDGVIYFGESLRGNLAIGLDFPVAVGMACTYHLVYGNTRPFLFGPINPINISRVEARRNMLEGIPQHEIPSRGMDRTTLIAASHPVGLMDKIHVNGLWALAADRPGMISAHDVELYQQGIMFYELARRRRNNRDHVLPFYRGGPISVAGHSWFVGKLFGVQVYQQSEGSKSD